LLPSCLREIAPKLSLRSESGLAGRGDFSLMDGIDFLLGLEVECLHVRTGLFVQQQDEFSGLGPVECLESFSEAFLRDAFNDALVQVAFLEITQQQLLLLATAPAAGKVRWSPASAVLGFQYDDHNCSFACGILQYLPPWGGPAPRLWKQHETDDDVRRKDLLVHQYITRERGSIALAEVAPQGGLQHYEEQ